MKFLVATILSLCVFGANATTIFGAIRWDPWYGVTNLPNITATLGPSVWQNRAPWFAVSNSSFDMTINGNTSAIMNQEISYAASAGISYWAFLYYGTQPISTNTADSGMMNAFRLYQAVSNPAVKWVLMEQFDNLTATGYVSPTQNALASYTSAYIAYFQEASYQTVTVGGVSGRPVMMFYMDSSYAARLASYWGNSAANVAAAIAQFRTAVQAAGIPNPYIIMMTSTGTQASGTGMDGITAYIPAFGTTAQPETWSTTVAAIEGFWASQASVAAAVGLDSIPIAAEGFDTRPRKQNILSFQNTGHKHFGMSTYAALPTAVQFTQELQDAVTYVNANNSTVGAGQDPSNLILVYAWSECDEGGNCICPHWSSNGSPDLTTLNAVGAVSK